MSANSSGHPLRASTTNPRGRSPQVRRRRRSALRGVGARRTCSRGRITRRHGPMDQRNLRRSDVPLRTLKGGIRTLPEVRKRAFDASPRTSAGQRVTQTRRRRGGAREILVAWNIWLSGVSRTRPARSPRPFDATRFARSHFARRVHPGQLQSDRPDVVARPSSMTKWRRYFPKGRDRPL